MTFPAIRPAIFFAAAAAAAFVTLSFAPRTFAQATPEVKRSAEARRRNGDKAPLRRRLPQRDFV